MKKLLELLSIELGDAFQAAGYESEYGKVTVSNRPDLCEFQCNGSLALAKRYKKNPLLIAQDIAAQCQNSIVWESVEAVMPGFLNLIISPCYLTDYLNKMQEDPHFGVERQGEAKTVIIDYGGANVAKPLHVGHIRPAIIGECIKRLYRFVGHKVIGDAHLGDWGLQIGLVIASLRERDPLLPYFQEGYEGEYPLEPPFSEKEFDEMYPAASARSKIDPEFRAEAMSDTLKLQEGDKGYMALWRHIMQVSVKGIKENYAQLKVDFDLWKGESDVRDLIPDMVSYLKEEGYAYLSQGALVVDVKEPTDTKEIPPCMILKSDGAALYPTTDLATILERMNLYNPDEIIYMTDKRQDLYFEQIFRCAKKTKMVKPQTQLRFLGFGTMNGKDGKPFKTRDGGVMRLQDLIAETKNEMYRKIRENRDSDEKEAWDIAQVVAIAALKYADMSNQVSKDYSFDIDRFTSFEGDTGPYILYTIVRVKSILSKYKAQGGNLAEVTLQVPTDHLQKQLMIRLAAFHATIENACTELAPHKICAYIYELSNVLNQFYHGTKILSETDQGKKSSMLALLLFTKEILETCIDILGFSAPEKM
ncbi:MAG: arginine--tRNA ligase [Lachnospiraceae bacterium]|nr:arginine--tRNA ligase [Lachnospiraceae bacterium]